MTKLIIPIDIVKKTIPGSTPTGQANQDSKSSQYFLQTPPPINVTAVSSANIRLPLFDFSKNYKGGMVSFERLYRDGTSDMLANMVVKSGAINKALKNAMLYNYFGYPVSNIALESDSDFSTNDYDSFEFSSQNHYDYKTHLHGWIYASYEKKDTFDDTQFGVYASYRAKGISTRQVYQFGKMGQLPDFGSVNSYEDIKSLYEQTNFRSFKDLDNQYGFSLSTNIFKNLHGDNSSFTGWYEQSFVDMIGLSPEASVFHGYADNNLYLYKSKTALDENIANGKLFGSYKGGLTAVEKITTTAFSPDSGIDTEPEAAQYLLAEQDPALLNPAFEALFSDVDEVYGFSPIQSYNALLDLTQWSKYNNPITKTHSRAWLPSFQGARNSNIGYQEVADSDIQGNQETTYTEGIGEGAVSGFTIGYVSEYSKIINKNYADNNLTFKGSSDYSINSLGMILGQYGASNWYKYSNNEGLFNENDIELQSFQDANASGQDNLISETYDKFARDNFASQFKLVPGTAVLGSQTDLVANDELDFYTQNPARTLNAIMPYVMNYITKVIPNYTPDGAADDWKSPNDYQTPADIPSKSINSTDVITKVDSEDITPKDFLRKFRFSTQDMSSFSEGDIKDSLGYTHHIGDLGSSGESLGLSSVRNRLTLATTSVAQREYLTYGSLATAPKSVEIGYGLYFDNYVKFLPFDKNFIYNPYQPAIKTQFVDALATARLSKMVANGSSEISINSMFSLFALAQMYMKLPPYYFKSAELEGYFAETSPEGISTDFTIYNEEFDFPEGLTNAVIADIATGGGAASALTTIGYKAASEDGEIYWQSMYGYGGIGFLSFPEAFYGNAKELGNSLDVLKDVGDIDVVSYGSYGEDKLSSIKTSIKNQSDLTLPVWNYAKKDLDSIDWNTISDDNEKVSDLQKAINKNEQIANAINYGIPKWVTGLRVYPTLDSDTTISNLNQPELNDGISAILSENQAPVASSDETSYVLGNYKTSESENIKYKAMAALKLVIEPEIESEDPPTVLYQPGTEDGVMHRAYAEMKYAVEIDIDERELVLDLAAQGIVAFAGTIEEYQDLGFDPETLILISNGNVASPSLQNLADEIAEGIQAVNDGYDFGNWPGLIAEGKAFEVCLDTAPPEVIEKVNKIKATDPDPYVCTSYVCLNAVQTPSIALKQSPGKDSNNVGYLADRTVVKVLKEWVNGQGDFDKVIVTDPSSPISGSVGFIDPSVLKSARSASEPPIFFEEIFDTSLAKTKVEARSEMAEALNPSWWKIPLNSIAETSEPYIYIQEGEVHYPVTLDADCIVDEDDLESMRAEAKIKGIKEIFAYFDKVYTDEDVEKFAKSYLAVRIEKNDYYLDSRPGSKVIMLLRVGGVYLNAIESQAALIEDLKEQATKKISLNTSWYQVHLQQAVYSLNKLYNDMAASPYRVVGFNFFKEAKRLSYLPVVIKKMLAVNGYNTNPQEENTINVGFDDNFNLLYVTYQEKGSQEKLLNIGLSHFKNTEPFVFSNTMSLFYHHREMKNPLLKWQVLFKDWLPEPKPQIVSSGAGPSGVQISKCSPYFDWTSPSLSKLWDNALGQLAEMLDLDPRYDLGAFQFNLLQYFPPCPRPASGRGPGYLNFTSQINGQSRMFADSDIIDGVTGEVNRFGEYVGDWLSSGEALKDIQTKIFDLDDLYSYVLNYITPELLYSKICKCFIDLMDVEEISVPNLKMSADFGSGGMSLNPKAFAGNQEGGNTKDFFEFDKEGYEGDVSFEREVLKTEDLFCSFCFRMPSIFLRLPSTDILSELVNAIKAALEFAIAQILMQLIKALLEILLTCPEIKCGPEENVGRVEDFGALNINDFTSDIDFDKCGLLIDGVNVTREDVQQMLLEVSNSLTTTEVLSLVDGTASSPVIKTINIIVAKYPAIQATFSNPAIIEDFFLCIGDNIDEQYLNDILEDTANQFSDPTVCADIQQDAKQKLIDKCGNIEDINEIIKKSYNHDIEKYKKIAKIIRENDNLSNQLPPLFTDGKGTQSMLSGLNFDTLDYALDQVIDTNSIPTETQLNIDTSNFFNPSHNQYVKASEVSYLYDLPDRQFMIFEAFGVPTQTNLLSGLNSKNEDGEFEVLTIDNIAFDMDSYTQTGDYELKFSTLGDDIYVAYKLNSPKTVNGTTVFSNNFTLSAKRTKNTTTNSNGVSNSTIIESNFGEKEFAADVKDFLEAGEYELFSNEIPEQVQAFSNMLKNAGGLNKFLGQKGSEKFTALYSTIFYSLVSGINNSITENTLLETYRVDPFDKIGPDEYGRIALLLGAAFPAIGLIVTVDPTSGGAKEGEDSDGSLLGQFISANYPDLNRQQLENLNLNSLPISNSNQGSIPTSIIDFEKMKKVIKDAYDFSKEADQKSDAIQAPQKAFLFGYIGGFLQVFAGQVFAKAAHFLPFFPQQILTNNSNLLIDYIFETFEKDWLNQSQNESFVQLWKNIVCRLVAEMPEFKPDTGFDKLPQLPGENPQEYASKTLIKGSIYDMNLGADVRIESWKDATKYLIRQNYESPLAFIKQKLSTTQLQNNKIVSGEISPLDFIAYQDILPIHNRLLNFKEEVSTPSKSPSLHPVQSGDLGDKEGFFNGGRFFFQQYIELEELEPYVNLGTTQDINFALQENYEENELYNQQFVNRPNELKGKLNPYQFAKLVQLLIPPGKDSQMGFGYDNQYKSRKLKDFFKSIKIGLRMCFGLNHYVYLDRLQDAPLEVNEEVKKASDNLLDIYENNLLKIAGGEAILEAFGASEEEIEASYDSLKEFINFIEKDKSFIVFEDVETTVELQYSTEVGSYKEIYTYSEEEIESAIFESNIAYDPNTGYKEDETPNQLLGQSIAKVITDTNANVSFILPLISKDLEVRNNPQFNMYFNKKLGDISEYDGSYEDYMENLSLIFDRSSIAIITQQLLSEVAFSQEYRILFSYIFAIPEVVNMYMIFFNLVVDTDPKVVNAFENTKKVMASSIESIYNMRGKNAYKVQPPLIEKSGGPKGLAQNASSGFDK